MSSQDSDIDKLSGIGLEVEQLTQQIGHGGVNPSTIQVNHSQDEQDEWHKDEEAYDETITWIEAIDLTQDDDEPGVNIQPSKALTTAADLHCEHYKKGLRNPCLCKRFEKLQQFEEGLRKLCVGQVFPLVEPFLVGRYLIDFIEVTRIYKHRKNPKLVIVRGMPYTRTRNMEGRLAAYKNEVCRIVEVETNDSRPVAEQSVIEVPLDMVSSVPRELHKTNKPFPECRFDDSAYHTSDARENMAPLTCRWEQSLSYPDRRFRRHQRPIDGTLLKHLTEDDVPKSRHRASDPSRLARWRGEETRRGGSHIPGLDKHASINGVQAQENGEYVRLDGQRYSVADMFSGAGGFTTGAKKAGFHVEVAVDSWDHANATYRANHPEVSLHEMDIMEFCNDLTLPRHTVDVLHLSPPCQAWSPAHTSKGRNDEANIKALFACAHIVAALRPRLVTLEQTFGLAQERHLVFFNALVRSLTKHGYCLTWKVVHLMDFGLPQSRKRLVLIGSAPGQPIPFPWPSATHSDKRAHAGLARTGAAQGPLVSAIRACRGLVEGIGLHDVAGAKVMDNPPWDGNKPMMRTITTSGGQAYHWSGQRGLTLAEFMCLQGFPIDYEFRGYRIIRQIGNAFPPTVVERIMAHVRRWLEKTDRIKAQPCEIISSDSEDTEENEDHKFCCSDAGGFHQQARRSSMRPKRDRSRSSSEESVILLEWHSVIPIIDDDVDGKTCQKQQQCGENAKPLLQMPFRLSRFLEQRKSSLRRQPSPGHDMEPISLIKPFEWNVEDAVSNGESNEASMRTAINRSMEDQILDKSEGSERDNGEGSSAGAFDSDRRGRRHPIQSFRSQFMTDNQASRKSSISRANDSGFGEMVDGDSNDTGVSLDQIVFDLYNPIRNMGISVEQEKEEGSYEGKGKGKAIAKRTFQDDSDGDNHQGKKPRHDLK